MRESIKLKFQSALQKIDIVIFHTVRSNRYEHQLNQYQSNRPQELEETTTKNNRPAPKPQQRNKRTLQIETIDRLIASNTTFKKFTSKKRLIHANSRLMAAFL